MSILTSPIDITEGLILTLPISIVEGEIDFKGIMFSFLINVVTYIHHRRREQWRSKGLALQALLPGSPPLSNRPENKSAL